MKILISKNLKDLLKSRDMTIAQLARATGIAQQTLNNWLAGLEPRSMVQIKKVANHFEVSVDWLVYGEKGKVKETDFNDYKDEINAGVFEVILRRTK